MKTVEETPEAQWSHGFVRANGLRFHYVTAGKGQLVILLHGFPQSWVSWRHQISALSQKFRVVAPDMRGYGDTDKPPRVADYRMENLTDDVVELIHAFGEQKACIVGHDWGGMVAWMVALRHPKWVEKLAVLNCPHPIRFSEELWTVRQLRKSAYMFFFQLPWVSEWLLTRNNSELVALMFRRTAIHKGTFSDLDIAEYRKALGIPGAVTGMLNYYRAAFRYRQAINAVEGSILTMPTCLIWGEEDRALGKELTYGTRALCSGPFELHYFSECGHWVNEEQPERVNELLIRFLR